MTFIEKMKDVGEMLDRLLSVPIFTSPSLTKKPVLLELYQAARDKFREPLTYLAANEILNRVNKGDTVLIVTGAVIPPWFRPEHDGPAGAVTLARALNLGLDATPVIVAEKVVTDRMTYLCQACGFEVTDYNEAKQYPRRIALANLPVTDDIAKQKAKSIFDEMNPSLIIFIEKGSPNEKGVYHVGTGWDVSAIVGKVSYLIEEAKNRGIFTIGIGDGGNEVGMGCIKEIVKAVVPMGTECGCPCGAGVHSDIATDLLVVAMVSNWGAYALEALLAIAKGKPEIMHDSALEDKVFEAAPVAGIIDPTAGFGMASGDAIDKYVHLAIVDIMNFIVKSEIRGTFYKEKYRESQTIWRAAVQEKVKDWASDIQRNESKGV